MPATLGPYNGLTWNWDDYDSSSNPRGLGKGGFREETGLKLLLNSVLADVAVSLQMTATDSVAISAGSKTFTPATMRGVTVGLPIWMIYDANNKMYGTIATVTATQITVTVAATGVTGSGTRAVWTLQPTGPAGPEPNLGKLIGVMAAAS